MEVAVTIPPTRRRGRTVTAVDADRWARLGALAGGWARPATGALLAAAVLVLVSAHIPARSQHAWDPPGYLLIVLAGVMVGICSRRPRLAVAVTTTALCVFVARDYPDGPVWLAGPVTLAVLSARTDRRTAVSGAAVMFAALTVTALSTGRFGVLFPLIYLGWSAAAVFGGEAVRSRRSYRAGLAERARFAERSREQETARRVVEERLRIARDLHDSVAHAMATITVQAGAAAHVLERKPEVAGAALTAIQKASAEVLEELGSMLAVLRDDAERAERSPAPGIGDLARLVDSVAASGLAVELQADAATPGPAPAVSTAAYRVVQESLTNVLRHSQARDVCVRVRVEPAGGVLVEVADPGPAREGQAAGAGVGLRGMEERVTATGGLLTAGTAAGGGFQVRAVWEPGPGASPESDT
jgi:signal transduction histidine kinase